MARVTVRGDAPVRLVAADGSRPSLREVPPGGYQVEASYAPSEWTAVGRVTLASGEVLEITCVAAIRNCRF